LPIVLVLVLGHMNRFEDDDEDDDEDD